MSRQHLETRRRLKNIASLDEFKSILQAAKLTDRQRTITELYYINGLSFELIGDRLGFTG